MTSMANPSVRENSGEATSGLSRPSITACLRCREQKLKCGRERPACARCARLTATCQYPSPPDRRGLRTRRKGRRPPHRVTEHDREQTHPQRAVLQHPYYGAVSRETPATAAQIPIPNPIRNPRYDIATLSRNNFLEGGTLPNNDAEADDIPSPQATGTPLLPDPYSAQLHVTSSFPTELAPSSDQPPLPPTALGLSLLEIYFSRVYNASLLFDKPFLFQQYLTGGLHSALLKAILALATLFLRPRNIGDDYHVSSMPSELKVLSSYHTCGFPWAKAALREALILAVEAPSLMVTQALACLQLYWFGIGQPYSGNLCLTLAYRSCHLLGYSKKITDDTADFGSSLESELGRRCFWACWTSTCIVMEPEPFIKSCWQEVAEVPLPGVISTTLSGYRITLIEKMDGDWHSNVLVSGTRTGLHLGAAGHLMKMVGLWAKVQLLCKDNTSAITRNFDSVLELSRLATSLFDNAISSRSPDYQNDLLSEAQALLIVHDAIYHQCQITIHSIIVPIFSGFPPDPKIGIGMQKESAEAVARHAMLFHSILEPYRCGKYDISRLPPVVGYGAFVAGIVLLITDISCRERERNRSSTETVDMNETLAAVNSILHLLDNLRVYWTVLQRPWETLRSALQTEFSKRKGQPKPANSQDQLLAQVKDCDPPVISERYNHVTDTLNDHLQPSAADSSEREGLGIQRGPHPTTTVENQVAAHTGIEHSSPLLRQIDLPQDYLWYNLSFAEAGVEQFSGLDPFTLFQQGWRTFG